MRRGDVHVRSDYVMETEVRVDIGRSNLARRDCTDDGCGAGYGIAARKYMGRVRDKGVGFGLYPAADNRGHLFKGLGVDRLADRNNHNIAWDAEGRCAGVVGTRTSVRTIGPDDLRACPQCGDMAGLIRLDAVGRLQGQDLAALALRLFDLLRERSHVIDAAAVDAGHRLCAKADGGAGRIHRHIAAADDTDALALKVRDPSLADVAQKLHSRVNALTVLAFDAELFVVVRADRDIDCVVLVFDFGKRDVLADCCVCMYLNAGRQDKLDVRIQLFRGQAVIRDAVAQHTAKLRALVVHNNLMPHQRQEIGGRQPAGAAADNADPLAGGFGAGRGGPVGRVVACKPLDAADVDRIVHHAAAAARLAGMLADIAADGGEGVVLADQAHGVVVPPGAHQRDIPGDIDPGRAERHAGYRLVQPEQAAAVFNMGNVVLAEALYALQNHARRFIADRAIRSILNDACGFLNQVDRIAGSGRIQYAFQQGGQLPQPDPAGDTFAAGLCMAEAEKR